MSQLLSSSTVDQYAGSCLVPKTERNNHVSFHGVKSDSLVGRDLIIHSTESAKLASACGKKVLIQGKLRRI